RSLARSLPESRSTSQRTAVYEARTYSGVRGAPRRYLAAGPPTRLCLVLFSFFQFTFRFYYHHYFSTLSISLFAAPLNFWVFSILSNRAMVLFRCLGFFVSKLDSELYIPIRTLTGSSS